VASRVSGLLQEMITLQSQGGENFFTAWLSKACRRRRAVKVSRVSTAGNRKRYSALVPVMVIAAILVRTATAVVVAVVLRESHCRTVVLRLDHLYDVVERVRDVQRPVVGTGQSEREHQGAGALQPSSSVLQAPRPSRRVVVIVVLVAVRQAQAQPTRTRALAFVPTHRRMDLQVVCEVDRAAGMPSPPVRGRESSAISGVLIVVVLIFAPVLVLAEAGRDVGSLRMREGAARAEREAQ